MFLYAGGQTLNLYENVTLIGGWTVYPISYIVVENTSVALWCKWNERLIPVYQVKSFDETTFGNAIQKFGLAYESGTLKLNIDRFSKKHEGDWRCFATVLDANDNAATHTGPVRKVELAGK